MQPYLCEQFVVQWWSSGENFFSFQGHDQWHESLSKETNGVGGTWIPLFPGKFREVVDQWHDFPPILSFGRPLGYRTRTTANLEAAGYGSRQPSCSTTQHTPNLDGDRSDTAEPQESSPNLLCKPRCHIVGRCSQTGFTCKIKVYQKHFSDMEWAAWVRQYQSGKTRTFPSLRIQIY